MNMSQGKEIKYEEKIPFENDAKSTEGDVTDRMKAGPFSLGSLLRHLIKSKVELQITIGTFLQGQRRSETG